LRNGRAYLVPRGSTIEEEGIRRGRGETTPTGKTQQEEKKKKRKKKRNASDQGVKEVIGTYGGPSSKEPSIK